MSHTVTVTRTTTTTTTSALLLNTGYLKTYPGLLKVAQLILGIVCVGVVGYYITPYYNNYSQKPELFFLLMATTFMIGTFCLLVSCIISIATGSFIAKTVFEVVYHFVAFLLLLIAGIIFLVEINNHRYPKKYYDPYLAASILGLVNAVLYAISTFLAQRSYRGI